MASTTSTSTAGRSTSGPLELHAQPEARLKTGGYFCAGPKRISGLDALVRDVRRPDPLGTPEDRPARQTRSQSARALCTGTPEHFLGRWHLRPRRRSAPASTPSCTARHSPRPRAAADRTGRTGRGTPLGPFRVAIVPASGIISPTSPNIPPGGAMRGSAAPCSARITSHRPSAWTRRGHSMDPKFRRFDDARAAVLFSPAGAAGAPSGVWRRSRCRIRLTSAQTVAARAFTLRIGMARGPLPRVVRGLVGVLSGRGDVAVERLRHQDRVWTELGLERKVLGGRHGGWAGRITYGALADALRRGYAAASTDRAHRDGARCELCAGAS